MNIAGPQLMRTVGWLHSWKHLTVLYATDGEQRRELYNKTSEGDMFHGTKQAVEPALNLHQFGTLPYA
jgi:hypothetical protein